MAGNIIPAIATTNAMTASLCVLQSFKVLRGEYNKARMQFLSKSAERLISSEPLGRPRADCPVCGVCQAIIKVDLSRATLRHLVNGLLQGQLAYGEELAVSTEAGVVYDPDLDDNLDKKLSEMSVMQDTFLTIIDESDDEPRVNVSLAVTEEDIASEEPPISLTEILTIPRKIKLAEPTTNGTVNGAEANTQVNGNHGTIKRKRSADEADLEADIISKRGKVMEQTTAGVTEALRNGVHIIDDGDDGAILIDDD